MPGLMSIQNRDIFSLVEFSLDELRKLDLVMNNIEIVFDGKSKEEIEAKDYFIKEFYPFFQELMKEMEQHASHIK